MTLDGAEIELTQKETQLLSFWASHAGREFGADEIYEAIWGGGSDAAKAVSTVCSHVSNLRRKVRGGNEYFDILMMPGKGYTFMRTRFVG